jgi:hypothetical protein
MLCSVALVRTDVLEERITFIIKMTRMGELGTMLAVTSSILRLLVTAEVVPSSPILVSLMMEVIYVFKTLVLYKSHRV